MSLFLARVTPAVVVVLCYGEGVHVTHIIMITLCVCW